MSIVVDLPAPLGPSSATVSPAAIETSMPRDRRHHRPGGAKGLRHATELDVALQAGRGYVIVLAP